MGLFDYYLPDDLDQVTDHLENLHKATTGIFSGSLKADFTNSNEYQISIQHSLRVLVLLHEKKLKHEKNMKQNYAMYKSQGWMNREKSVNKS